MHIAAKHAGAYQGDSERLFHDDTACCQGVSVRCTSGNVFPPQASIEASHAPFPLTPALSPRRGRASYMPLELPSFELMIRPDDRDNSQRSGNSFGRHRRPDSEQTIFTRHRIVLEGHPRSIYGVLWLALDLDKSDWLAATNAQAGAHCDHCLVPWTVDRMAITSANAVKPARSDCAR